MGIKETVSNSFSHWMKGEGSEADVIISSRIRVARNLSGVPFPHMLSAEKAQEVIHAVRLAVNNMPTPEKTKQFEFCCLNELTDVERQVLVEKHLISPDMLQEDAEKRAIALREDEVVSIMVNEEDHLRIQCLLPGLQLDKAWEITDKLDDCLENIVDYAFSERLGFLTACPTNVGTGLRASVMVHLPGLVLVNQINGVLTAISKLGINIRGKYGEGTDAKGNLFQISNQITLGRTEEEIIDNLTSVTKQLISQEKTARHALYRERKDFLEDRVCRAYGILKHARVISSEEALRFLSDVRLGCDLGIIKNVNPRLLTELIVMTMPAYITKQAGKGITASERDIKRADLLRQKLGQ